MKKIFRMLIFSAVAIAVTALWNKGFVISYDWKTITQAVIIIAAIFYLIVPISKIILLPLNILTLGLVSVLFYFVLFYFVTARYSFIHIKEWIFPGISFAGFIIKETKISYLINVVLSAVSISTVINLLEVLI